MSDVDNDISTSPCVQLEVDTPSPAPTSMPSQEQSDAASEFVVPYPDLNND